LVRYVQAMKGQAPMVKKHLPVVCPDVDYIERMLESPEAIVILTKEGDDIVGVAGGWLEGTPSGHEVEDATLKQYSAYYEAHLDWIAVREEYREKGIGATLIEKLCIWAKENGKEKIWTEVSPETTAFYQKLEFQEIGRFQNEKQEEYVTMLKQL